METLTIFIEEYLLNHSSPEEWDIKAYPLIQQYNNVRKDPVSEEQLLMIYTDIKNKYIKKVEVKQDPIKEEEEIKKLFIKDKTKGTYELAKYLTQKYNIITIGEKEREMYVYQKGVYFRSENEIIYPEIQRILQEAINKNAKAETFHKIADMTSHPRDVFQLAPLNFIPLANGVYDMNTKSLLPQSPEYRFTYQFPIKYDPKVDCPKTKAFFEQVLTSEQYKVIQEWIGYYFYRLYIFKKAIIFVGEGDTGKTTLLETIINLLGRDNISSISLQKMTSDKFAGAHLYGKHGNLVDELSAKDISDTGNFKIATGGGSITGEYKFGNQFSFLNFSKFTFACNKIPDVKDFDDLAYFNRWMVISFSKTIENKIPNFISTITTEEERSGLFNFAMEGLERLLKQGRFSHESTAMDTKREMMKSGSSIAMFTSTQVEQEAGAEMSKEKMYDAYSDFCVSNGLAVETIQMFGTKFLFYCPFATEGLINDVSRKRVRGWRNAVIKKTEAQEQQNTKADADFDEITKHAETKF